MRVLSRVGNIGKKNKQRDKSSGRALARSRSRGKRYSSTSVAPENLLPIFFFLHRKRGSHAVPEFTCRFTRSRCRVRLRRARRATPGYICTQPLPRNIERHGLETARRIPQDPIFVLASAQASGFAIPPKFRRKGLHNSAPSDLVSVWRWLRDLDLWGIYDRTCILH